VIKDLKIENLTPFMQVLIKQDLVQAWIDAPNKINSSIHGFTWEETDYENDWNIVSDILYEMGQQINAKKYLNVDYPNDSAHEYTKDYEDTELTCQEIEHIWEIYNSFPEYRV